MCCVIARVSGTLAAAAGYCLRTMEVDSKNAKRKRPDDAGTESEVSEKKRKQVFTPPRELAKKLFSSSDAGAPVNLNQILFPASWQDIPARCQRGSEAYSLARWLRHMQDTHRPAKSYDPTLRSSESVFIAAPEIGCSAVTFLLKWKTVVTLQPDALLRSCLEANISIYQGRTRVKIISAPFLDWMATQYATEAPRSIVYADLDTDWQDWRQAARGGAASELDGSADSADSAPAEHDIAALIKSMLLPADSADGSAAPQVPLIALRIAKRDTTPNKLVAELKHAPVQLFVNEHQDLSAKQTHFYVIALAKSPASALSAAAPLGSPSKPKVRAGTDSKSAATASAGDAHSHPSSSSSSPRSLPSEPSDPDFGFGSTADLESDHSGDSADSGGSAALSIADCSALDSALNAAGSRDTDSSESAALSMPCSAHRFTSRARAPARHRPAQAQTRMRRGQPERDSQRQSHGEGEREGETSAAQKSSSAVPASTHRQFVTVNILCACAAVLAVFSLLGLSVCFSVVFSPSWCLFCQLFQQRDGKTRGMWQRLLQVSGWCFLS